MNDNTDAPNQAGVSHSVIPLISLRDLLMALFKWQWTIVISMSIVVALTLIWLVVFKSPVYQVSAKLLVKLGAEQSSPSTIIGQPPPTVSYRAHDVNSEVEILSSPYVLGKLVDTFQLDVQEEERPPESLVPLIRYRIRTYKEAFSDAINEFLIKIGFRERLSAREQVIYNLGLGLGVTPQRESHVIHVSMMLPSRVGSSNVLNKLIEIYLERRRAIFTDQAVDFFSEQVARYREELAAAEERLEELEARTKISDIEKQKEILLEHIALARRDFAQARLGETAAKERFRRFDREISKKNPDFSVAGTFSPGSFAESMMIQLSDLMRERERLKDDEQEGGRRRMENENQVNLLIEQLHSSLAASAADHASATRQIAAELASIQSRLEELSSDEHAWRNTQREASALEQSYALYRKKLSEATVRQALLEREVGNVVLIQPAIDPLLPAGIRKSTTFVLVIFLAGFGLLAFIVIAEFFDHRFYTPDQLEAELGVPVIGCQYNRRIRKSPAAALRKVA